MLVTDFAGYDFFLNFYMESDEKLLIQVKSRVMELAVLLENEDGVAGAVDAFHRHLPSEMPLPTPPPEDIDGPNPLQWIFTRIGKICCLPCGS